MPWEFSKNMCTIAMRVWGTDLMLVCWWHIDTKLNGIKKVKDFLYQNLEMKDFGVAGVILNIKLLWEKVMVG